MTESSLPCGPIAKDAEKITIGLLEERIVKSFETLLVFPLVMLSSKRVT
jgi:hypothetical protein